MRKKTIVAVVVTYNRKELLMENINAILSQDLLVDNIVLIDNNSTDGTRELLMEKGILFNKRIIYKRLEHNLGGAGGFYEGIKESMKLKPDWVWIMDDDTIPTINCLSELINSKLSFRLRTANLMKLFPLNAILVLQSLISILCLSNLRASS